MKEEVGKDDHLIAAMSGIIELSKSAPSGEEILIQCLEVSTMLLEKNISYGNSALRPVSVFSHIPTDDQINARIDDKLSRIKNSKGYPGDNDILDLIGYLVLKLIHQKEDKRSGGTSGKKKEV